MDSYVLQTKLESLIRCVNRIKAQNISAVDELENDIDKQDVIILNLQRAVQICVDIGNHILLDFNSPTPSTMAETFRQMAKNNIISDSLSKDLGRAVGFRNIAVHQYEDIDCRIIFSIIKEHLDDFKLFAEAITKFI